ncbi:hypothetical protein E2562_037436 [Oryza meyeriana var. granulata]|uniref:Uncharacterized protein n=1 Tax=Oryza meyeriana var. granulata TaxID=110450 RepID=A0A6G1FG94_9ORYZ|nr:hypothetical protein E2562_037436 [Oryza meyeriana var. granulata]
MHVWAADVAERLIGRTCTLEQIETDLVHPVDSGDTRTINLWAWMANPSSISKRVWLGITSRAKDSQLESVTMAEKPPEHWQRGVKHPILFHLEEIHDYTSATVDLANQSACQPTKRRLPPWNLGVMDDDPVPGRSFKDFPHHSLPPHSVHARLGREKERGDDCGRDNDDGQDTGHDGARRRLGQGGSTYHRERTRSPRQRDRGNTSLHRGRRHQDEHNEPAHDELSTPKGALACRGELLRGGARQPALPRQHEQEAEVSKLQFLFTLRATSLKDMPTNQEVVSNQAGLDDHIRRAALILNNLQAPRNEAWFRAGHHDALNTVLV